MSLARALARRRVDEGRSGFIPFIECGDRTLRDTEKYALALAKAGADIIELGVPFSDPVADGPTIQAASERALKGGASMTKALALAKRLKAKGAPPIILFTYLNPVLRHKNFAKACADAGVAGVLIVDLPAEEWGGWKTQLEKRGVEPVLLASPTTTDERLKLIGRRSGSIVYYVSREGVTGVRAKMTNISARLRHVRRTVSKPLIVGFGVARRDQAKALAKHCDGVVVGSALVTAAARGGEKALTKLSLDLVAGLTL